MDKGNQEQALWQKGLVRDLAALALLLALCLLFFWRVITPDLADRGSFRQGDFYDQFYAFSLFESGQLSQGQLPLWNPYTFSGHPFLADVQSAVFYPPSLATILLGGLGGFSAFALELEAIAHFFLAGAFTYFFAKRLLHNRAGALVSAVTFAFGGYLASYPALQLAILETVVWLPLILLLLDLGLTELGHDRRRAILYLLLAGLVLGVAILAGHPQSAMYVFYLSGLYFLFNFWYVRRLAARRPDSAPVTVWSALAGFALFLLAGLGLAAAQILPSWEYMQLSSRPELGYQELAGGFAYLDLVQILLPHATGFWSPLYVGIFPLLLALFAVYQLVRGEALEETAGLRPGWRAQVAFWAIVAGLALLLTLGGENFAYSFFYLFVPGFGLFRGQERAALAFSLALSLLAGYGFTALLAGLKEAQEQERSFRAILWLVVGLWLGVAALLALLYVGRWAAEPAPTGVMDAMVGLGLFVALLLGGCLLWLFVWKWLPEIPLLGIGLALGLVVADLFIVNSRPNVQKRLPENQYRPSGVIQELQAQPGTFRVHNEFRLEGNYGVAFGLEDTWGASPLRLASYERLLEQVPQERAWELLNVGYVVTWLDDLDAAAQRIYEEPAKRGEVTYLHRLEAEHPRAWIVYETEVASSEDQVFDRLAQPDFDPYRIALLSGGDPAISSELAAEPPAGEPQVRLVENSPSRLVVEVDGAADGLLVLSEIDYPGWQATVDGQPAPILCADAVLRAVEVPAGQHRVEMTFSPASVKLGLAISTATLLLSAAYILWCLVSCVRKPGS